MPYKNITPEDLFHCKMCGDCCRGYGGTYVSEADVDNIAAYLSMTPEQFLKNCCVLSGSRPLLAQGENDYCLFWDGKCSIHPVKPRMCKEWPFITGVLADAGNWDIMAASCPGIRAGFPPDVIRHHVKQHLAKKQ